MKLPSFNMFSGSPRLWITPVVKQCFVTVGVTLNMAAFGLVSGFAVPLLAQLKLPDSTMSINDEEGSWIASLPAFFFFAGNFLVIPIMGKYGRRIANLISILLLIIAWTGISFAPSVTLLLVARALQGINMGMSNTLSSLLIGEYTSPKNRGAFLMTISVWISVGVLSSHTIGSNLTWRAGALVCAIIALIDLVIVFLSPESPSWLAAKGRYEESKRVFLWLRGEAEEEELSKMVEACEFIRQLKVKADVSESIFMKIRKNLIYFKATITKKEFYKPLIIVIHIYTLCLWSGVCIIVAYPEDYIHKISGYKVNVSLIITTLDAQRILSSILAIYAIKKIRRRIMLLVTVCINISAMISIAVYMCAKRNYTLSFDHPMIGILLTHCMVFAIATGTSSLPFTIAGEIFPLEDKTLAGGISMLAFTANFFVALKTMTYRFANFGIDGTLCIDVVILCYCFLIVWILLPETKDRTLQDIEDEFRGRPVTDSRVET